MEVRADGAPEGLKEVGGKPVDPWGPFRSHLVDGCAQFLQGQWTVQHGFLSWAELGETLQDLSLAVWTTSLLPEEDGVKGPGVLPHLTLVSGHSSLRKFQAGYTFLLCH